MKLRSGRFLLVALLLATFGVSSALAQAEDLTETYVSSFGYQVDHPEGWEFEDTPADDSSGNTTLMTSEQGDIAIILLEPVALSRVGVGDTPVEIMANRWEEFVVGTPQLVEDPNGRDVVVATLSLDGTPGLGFLIDFGDDQGWAMMAAYDFAETGDVVSDEIEELFLDIAVSFTPAEGGVKQPPGGTPAQLTAFDGTWQDAVAELAEAGVIGTGGSLVFNEPSAFFSGQGNFYTPLASNAPYRDIVMAGEITYTASATTETETCSLMAGIGTSTNNSVDTYAEIGFTNSNFFYFIDRYDGEALAIEELASDVSLSTSHHVLFVIQDGLVTVYLDGELVADGIEMRERAGTYGIALTGRGVGASCTGNNIWVYQAPNVTPGLCEATTGNTVNKRSGPGTSNAQAGQFQAGTIQEVVGQASDGSFTWWLLDDDTWVREDVVSIQGDCASIPVSTP